MYDSQNMLSVDMPSNTQKDNGYENLAIAVVLQAFKDYKNAYIQDKNCAVCKSIENFLKNSWIGDFFINLDLISLAREISLMIDDEIDTDIIDRKIMLNPSGKI